MKRLDRTSFLLCGIALLLVAFPVLAQETKYRKNEIDRKPLEDLGASINEKLEKKELDLEKPFLVEAKIALTAGGKIDSGKSKFTRTEGYPQMAAIAKQAIQAFGDAGLFVPLSDQGIEKLSILLQQNDSQFMSVLTLENKTPERAATTASVFNTMLKAVLLIDQNGVKKLDAVSKLVIQSSKISSREKNVIIETSIPKADFQKMLQEQLKKVKERKNEQL